MCSVNLPPTVSSVIRPQRHFDTILYTGNNASGRKITGLEFKPDLVWFKKRSSGSQNHTLYDSVRGAGKRLMLPSNAEEATVSDELLSFDDGGFTIDVDNFQNENGKNYVAWCWKGGGTAVSNSDGTITTSISANQEGGFSIVTYTGTGSAATIGHGLGKVPKLVITKLRDTTTQDWFMNVGEITGSHGTSAVSDFTGDRGKYIKLNSINAEVSETTVYPNTAATSTVYSVGTDNSVNGSGSKYVAYCWSEIPGYSKFGSYEGKSDADGTYVHLGFRPAFLMIRKRQGEDTVIYDVKRDTRNEIGQAGRLYWSLASSESGDTKDIDFHSNGFKCRKNNGLFNSASSNAVYVYMAFAEKPNLTPYNAVPTAKS